MEIWKDIKGFEGLYQISNLGNVQSIGGRFGGHGSDILMKLTPDKKGYLRVRFCDNYIKTTHKVHRLVAQSFIENINNFPQVNQ